MAKKKPVSVDPMLVELFKEGPSKSDYKRAEIISEAIRCFAEVGTENASLDLVGKRLKTTRSHIAYYFPTKDALFESIVHYISAHAQAMTVQVLQREKSPLGQLIEMLRVSFRWAEEFREHAVLLMFFYYRACHDPSSRALNSQLREVGAGRIASMLQRASEGTTEGWEHFLPEARGLQRIITGALLDALSTLPTAAAGPWKAKREEAELIYKSALETILTAQKTD